MIFAVNESLDCYFNLALEELFLREKEDDVFMLWQNDKTIVVGKNQNTLSEISSDYVKENGISVVRRITGGGAVYHDIGNLNYTFITSEKGEWQSDFSRFAIPVIHALAKMGISAKVSGRNDILVGDRKISGNAQTVIDGRVLHHGTLLFNSDISVLSKSLNPDKEKIESKGIKSVASRVGNLSELLGREISLSELVSNIRSEVVALYGAEEYEISDEDKARASALAESKYRTWEWNFGYSPKYTHVKKKRFTCGTLEARLHVENGKISNAAFYGDFFGTSDPADIASALCGVLHKEEEISSALYEFDLEKYFGKIMLSELLEILI